MTRSAKSPAIKKAAIAAVLKSLSNGETLEKACKAANIDRGTLRNWRKADMDLDAQVDSARMTAIDVIEDALFTSAQYGNITAQIFFLCNRSPDRWRHVNRTEITGADGQPVAFSFADLVQRVDGENGQTQAAKPERKASDRKV